MTRSVDTQPQDTVPDALRKSGAVPHDLCDQNAADPVERQKVFDHVSKFVTPTWSRSIYEVVTTLGLYSMLWMHQDSWIATIVAMAFRVRLFVMFHDMAHGAFFPSQTANMVVGTFFGVFTHTPLSFWKRGHNHHHRHSNNLKYPQLSQSSPWTLEQFNNAPQWKKTLYRFSYTPFGFLCVLPVTVFGILHRFVSKWYEHVIDFAYLGLIWYTDSLSFEWWSFVLAGFPAFSLFHAQHTFPAARRHRPDQWSFFENAMAGSSFLQIPWVFRYFTGNIEYHHIHHLNPLVPLYRLSECHRAAGKLFDRVPRTTIGECFAYMTPLAWDEKNSKFVNV